jgi:hypothetical protein
MKSQYQILWMVPMFDIENSFDFYRMLVADFDDLMSDKQSARKAIHCAITANHLPEWVWHDWLRRNDEVKHALGITNRASYFAHLNNFVWLGILKEIANGSKHFERQSFNTQHVRSYGAGPYGIGPYGHGYLLIDLGEGAGEDQRYLSAISLIEVCVRFWRDFFRLHRPDIFLEHSTHHTM